MKMSDALISIILQAGIGAIGGFLIGYMIRKIQLNANKRRK